MSILALSSSDNTPGYTAPASDQPAVYNYHYAVKDDYTGTNFEATETREGDPTSGSYSVDLPDGRTQIVTYNVADAYSGYVADVSYAGEPQYAPEEPAPQVYSPPPTVYKPTPAVYAPAPTVYTPAPAVYKPVPAEYKPAPAVYKPAPSVYTPAPVVYKSATQAYTQELTTHAPYTEAPTLPYKKASPPSGYSAEEGEGEHAPTLFRHAVA